MTCVTPPSHAKTATSLIDPLGSGDGHDGLLRSRRPWMRHKILPERAGEQAEGKTVRSIRCEGGIPDVERMTGIEPA
jgi:hypothetical protein